MNGYEYIRQLSRNSREAEEKAQRLEAAILEAEAIGDLTRLNKLAADEAGTATAKGFAFKDIFKLLDGHLPTMTGAMSFEYRIELCAYLGFLKKERDRLIEQVPSEWQEKRIKQLTHKEKEIELLLNGETDYEVNNDTESQAAAGERITNNEATNQSDGETPVIKNKKFEHPETTKWKADAREIGKKWFDKEPKEGKYPGVNDVAKHVEDQFKSRDIRGPRGDYLDWQTIKKEALTGVTGRPANGKHKKS
jgi:hypothetical protein